MNEKLKGIFENIRDKIAERRKNVPFIVGINGIDSSGKTEFSKSLKNYLVSQGMKVELIHIDEFHNPKSIRYSGVDEAENYYNKSFNLDLIKNNILNPIVENKNLKGKIKTLNLMSDAYDMERSFDIDEETVVLFEGVFIYREELNGYFDYRILIKVPFEESRRRGEIRDVPLYGMDVLRKYDEKYLPAQKKYFEEIDPENISDLVIDNSDWNNPKILS